MLAHATEMEMLYSKGEKVITVIAGDFNTGPSDPQFALEQTFSLLRHNFEWTWEGVPLPERVSLPAEGRYPDASFDGFLIRGARAVACRVVPIRGVSDHFPAILTIAPE